MKNSLRPGRVVTVAPQWIAIPIVCLLLFVAVYYFAVLTKTGQIFENAALAGQRLQPAAETADAEQSLAVISYASLGLAILVAALIGLIRRRPRLAIAGAGTIAVSVVVAEALKRIILTRPPLVDVAGSITHNSFPSGHTTIAMSILMATMIVVPYRARGWAMFFVFTWAVGIGAATIEAHWHRLSDTIGGDLLALAVGCLFSLWLAKSGELTSTGSKRFVARGVLVGFWTAAATFSLVIGGILLLYMRNVGAPTTAAFRDNAYMATISLASAASIIAGLVFWASWHRLQVPARKVPID